MSDTIRDRFGGTNPAWMRGYSERFEHKCVIDLDSIGRVIREAADEIDALQASITSLKIENSQVMDLALAERDKLRSEIERLNKRIEQLEDDKKFWKNPPNGVWVEKDAINAAWNEANEGDEYDHYHPLLILDTLGIVPCPKCGGTKRVQFEVEEDGRPWLADEPCDCPNNGWVIDK